jgi:hypothetical protein
VLKPQKSKIRSIFMGRVALIIVTVMLFLLFYNIGNVQADLKDGLVAYYSFNGNSDDSVGIDHG